MKDNKGFSLVELIIVIAIMAVLVGVLAPTYLQYVEKSKKSNDVSTVDSILGACEVAAVDPDVDDFTGITITVSETGTTVAPTDAAKANAKMIAEVKKIINLNTDGKNVALKSSKWGTAICFTATQGGDGNVVFAYSNTANQAGNYNFSQYASSITKVTGAPTTEK